MNRFQMKKEQNQAFGSIILNRKCIGNISVLFKQDLQIDINWCISWPVSRVRVEIIGFSTLIFFLFAQVRLYIHVYNGQGNAFWIHFIFYVTRENYDILATDFFVHFWLYNVWLVTFQIVHDLVSDLFTQSSKYTSFNTTRSSNGGIYR